MKRIGLIIIELLCVCGMQAKMLTYQQLQEGKDLQTVYDVYVASDGLQYYTGDTLTFGEPREGTDEHYSYVLFEEDYEAYKKGTFMDSVGVSAKAGKRICIKKFCVDYTADKRPYVIAVIGNARNDVVVFEDALQCHEVYKKFWPTISYYGYYLKGALQDFKKVARELNYKFDYDNDNELVYSGSYAGIEDCTIALEKGNDHYWSYSNVYVIFPERKKWQDLRRDFESALLQCKHDCGNPNKLLKSFNIEYINARDTMDVVKAGNSSYVAVWKDGVTTLYLGIGKKGQVVVCYQSQYGLEDELYIKRLKQIVQSVKSGDYESAENTAHMLNTFTDYYSEEGELTFEEAFKYIAHIRSCKKQKQYQRNILEHISRMMSSIGNTYVEKEEYEQAQMRFKFALQTWLFLYGRIPSDLVYKSYEEQVEDLSAQLDEAFPTWSMDYYEMEAKIVEMLPSSDPSKSIILPSKEAKEKAWKQVRELFL